MLKILGRDSSINVRKVLWLCDELDLDFEREEEWGVEPDSLRKPEFLALNPNALIPVVIDDDFVLWESNAILRYLANAYEGDWLYPQNPRARAPIDQWMDWQSTELNTSWRYAFMSLVRNSPAHQDPRLLAAACKGWRTPWASSTSSWRKPDAMWRAVTSPWRILASGWRSTAGMKPRWIIPACLRCVITTNA